MNYVEFLKAVIDGGISGCQRDEEHFGDHPKRLEGSIAGFELCRGKEPEELGKLLDEAIARADAIRKEQIDSRHNDKTYDIEDYWRARYVVIQVEWVCNVVSAMLMKQGLPTIVPPTVRGAMRAAAILELSVS